MSYTRFVSIYWLHQHRFLAQKPKRSGPKQPKLARKAVRQRSYGPCWGDAWRERPSAAGAAAAVGPGESWSKLYLAREGPVPSAPGPYVVAPPTTTLSVEACARVRLKDIYLNLNLSSQNLELTTSVRVSLPLSSRVLHCSYSHWEWLWKSNIN